MSQQPRSGPSHSSSPSKSSTTRRTTSGGGGTSTSTQPPSQKQQPHPTNVTTTRPLLPSPQFEDDPIVASHQQHSHRPSLTLNNPEYSEHAVAESENYSHGLPSATQQTGTDSIPSFQPFFTLIEDSVTNEHHHPMVHYIFADDDADIITEAALRSLEVLDPSQRVGSSALQGQASKQPVREEAEDSLIASRLPPPIAEMREHYLILDVQAQPTQQYGPSSAAPQAYTYAVTTAHSLSAEWQLLRTSITTAPTIGDNPASEDEGLMLRIEGRGNTPGDIVTTDKGKSKESEVDKDKEKESMEEMIERFQRRLEDVRMVVEAGGGVGQGGDVGAEE